MYFVSVGALMFVLPLASIAIALLSGAESASTVAVVAKWFVFWGVGVRLLVAGLRQIVRPRYTAETILGLKHDESLIVVRELGFANTAIGTIGVLSVAASGWVLAAALAGAIFYGLAGANHMRQVARNKNQNVAMVTDLVFGALLLVLCVLVRLHA
jgi:hypothetical protein